MNLGLKYFFKINKGNNTLKVFQNLRAGNQKQYIKSQPHQNIFSNWIYYYFQTISFHHNQLQRNHLVTFSYQGYQKKEVSISTTFIHLLFSENMFQHSSCIMIRKMPFLLHLFSWEAIKRTFSTKQFLTCIPKITKTHITK